MISLRTVFLGLAWIGLFQAAQAQENTTYQLFGGDYSAGLSTFLDLERWDPDGAGPLAECVLVVGAFDAIDGVPLDDMACFNLGTEAWSDPGGGLPGSFANSAAATTNGDLAVALKPIGEFNRAQVQVLDQGSWILLPDLTRTSGSGDVVRDMLWLQDGSLVVVGDFDMAGGLPVNDLAVWDGSQWVAVAQPNAVRLNAIGQLSTGELVAAFFGGVPNGVYEWNGAAWNYLAPSGSLSSTGVSKIQVLEDDSILATGLFFMPSATTNVDCALWNGASWEPIGSGGVISSSQVAVQLATGELLLGRLTTPSTQDLQTHLSWWDGTDWTGIEDDVIGMDSNVPGAINVGVRDLLVDQAGSLWAAGQWNLNPEDASSGLARGVSAFAPKRVSIGQGGTGSSGPIVLDSDDLPWLASSFGAQASGLSPTAIPLTLLSALPTDVPLAQVVPGASSDSSLLVLPNLSLLQALPNAQGTATFSSSIPDEASLLGATLRLQVLSLELDASLAVSSAATSNALELTLGAY